MSVPPGIVSHQICNRLNVVLYSKMQRACGVQTWCDVPVMVCGSKMTRGEFRAFDGKTDLSELATISLSGSRCA
jgi:hypothetical protein